MRPSRHLTTFVIIALLASSTTAQHASADSSTSAVEVSRSQDTLFAEQTTAPTSTPSSEAEPKPAQFASAIGQIPKQGSTLVTSIYDKNIVGLASKLAATSARSTAKLAATHTANEFIEQANKQNLTHIDNPDKKADFFVSADKSSFTVLLELASKDAPTTYDFDVLMPDDSLLVLTEEGAVDIVGRDGISVGTFNKPWAIDSQGKQVATHYQINGRTISQVIQPTADTVYPIIADPKFTWGWVTGTVYFNKTEIGLLCTISRHGLAALIQSGFWLPILLAVFATLTITSCAAQVLNKCIKVKSTLAVRMYSGGYCQ